MGRGFGLVLKPPSNVLNPPLNPEIALVIDCLCGLLDPDMDVIVS